MIYREYLTESDGHGYKKKYSITVITDDFHLYKTIKTCVENMCNCAEEPAFCVEESEAEE